MHPLRRPRVLDAARQALGDAEPALDLGQHQHAGIRGQATAVEGGMHRLAGDRRREGGLRSCRSMTRSAAARDRLHPSGQARPIRRDGGGRRGLAARAGPGPVRAGVPRQRRRRRVLPGLTAEDLKEIGVASVGHRRGCSTPSRRSRRVLRRPAAPRGDLPRPHPATRRGRAPAAHGDVRRPGRLDRAVAPARPRGDATRCCAPTRTPCAGEVARFEGHVAKFMGDGVLAYFGWPQRARGRGRAGGAGRARGRRGRRSPDDAGGRARWRRASGSLPGWSWSAVSSARARRGSRRSPARRRTWPPACRPWRSPATVVIAASTRRLLGTGVRARGSRAAGAQGLRRRRCGRGACSASARSAAVSRRARPA